MYNSVPNPIWDQVRGQNRDSADIQSHKTHTCALFEEATTGCSLSKQENKPIKVKQWIQKIESSTKEKKTMPCSMKEKLS